jgi:hypothetical protein
MLLFPEIRVADPISHESITIFPLDAEVVSQVHYVLSDEALEAGSVTVEEVGEAGSVPELVVDNQTDNLVLFLEGEELRGAKQNRVLNTSVLVAAKSKIKIPVSCVEQGRWAYQSKHFGSGGRHSPSKLRHALKSSVSQSLHRGTGHRSDQGKVWEEVRKQQASLGVSSQTAAMADSFEAHQPQIDHMAEQFQHPEGAVGVAVALGDKIVAVDLFDKAATCRKVWRRLLSGFILKPWNRPLARDR